MVPVVIAGVSEVGVGAAVVAVAEVELSVLDGDLGRPILDEQLELLSALTQNIVGLDFGI